MRRPKALFSGLIHCGVCGGPCSLRGQDRYACSARVTSGSCANTRTITRGDLEQRVLAGLKDRMMAPEMAAEAMRAYAEETNRLNRERRTSGESLGIARIHRTLKQMLSVIEAGGHTRGMTDRMRELEAREDVLKELLAQEPADIPVIHPNTSGIYRKKVERLTEALKNPEDRNEATEANPGAGREDYAAPWPEPRRNRRHPARRIRHDPRLDRGTSRWKDSETRNSRSFRYGSVGIGGCGDRI